MILVERHIIKKSNPLFNELDNLCFLSKNLYNSALYEIRQYFFEHKKYINWININNKFVDEKQENYYALPCKVSQQTLKMVDNNMKSFFNALKAKKSKPRLPKYLDIFRTIFYLVLPNDRQARRLIQFLFSF